MRTGGQWFGLADSTLEAVNVAGPLIRGPLLQSSGQLTATMTALSAHGSLLLV